MFSEGWFGRLCAGLDTPGGHMITCFLVIVLGAVLSKIGLVEEGRGLIATASGALLAAMRGLNGRSLQQSPPNNAAPKP